MSWTKKEQEEARETLSKIIKPGMTVYTTLHKVARSGMSRTIRCNVILKDEAGNAFPRSITLEAAACAGFTVNKDRELRVGGCGFDAGFHVVYALGAALFPEGFECIGEEQGRGQRCPSNDHSNGDRNYEPHRHESGGYALRHAWL